VKFLKIMEEEETFAEKQSKAPRLPEKEINELIKKNEQAINQIRCLGRVYIFSGEFMETIAGD
jgi:hypothetical protein